MKRNFKNKNVNDSKNIGAGLVSAHGITLISLVIIIILLIILAGVAISLSLGENGILNKAKQAKEEYTNAQVAEEKGINNLYDEMLIASSGRNDNNSFYQYEEGKIAIPTANVSKTMTLKTFTNLEPGVYYVSYTQFIAGSGSGFVTVTQNDEIKLGTALSPGGGCSTHGNVSGLINITNKSDKIDLNYYSNAANTAQDRIYNWQILKVR